MKYRDTKYVGYLALFTLMLFSLTAQYGLYINVSESLPHYIYLWQKSKDIKRGDYIVFKTALKDDPITKKVTGVAGDKIQTINGEVKVDGVGVGCAQDKRSDGKPLRVIESQTIPRDCYFVSGIHEKSFDSRYQEFGLVSKDMIIGKAIPIC